VDAHRLVLWRRGCFPDLLTDRWCVCAGAAAAAWRVAARLALALASCDRVTRLVRAERNRMRLENKFDEIRRLERQKAHRRQLAEQASAEKSLRIEEHLVQVRDTHRALLGRSGCGPLGTATQ
jgi:hypothetical protein